MPARDDSVIRGSLITCVIFLVLSLVLNFLLWRWGDTSATEAADAKTGLQKVNATVQKQTDQLAYLKAMIGVGEVNEAEFEQYAQSAADDPDLQKIAADYETAMSYFAPDVDQSRKNLLALPEYLVGVIRERVQQYNNMSQMRQEDLARAQADVKNARDAQALAQEQQAQAQTELQNKIEEFEKNRQEMKVANAKLQDLVSNQAATFRAQSDESSKKIAQLETKTNELIETVDQQRQRINTLQNAEFEVVQGEVTYTRPGDRLVLINLGSADALRPGVSFGVFDAEQTKVTEATPKATIEVVAIRRDHLAEARIVSDPKITEPIIPGDVVYSPFWSPGREVRIALAGTIDINGDGRDDTPLVRGMIESAGAEVAAVVNPAEGQAASGELDGGIRFLVVGEKPEVAESADPDQTQRIQEGLAEMGKTIDQARQLGITIIPAYKLLNFLSRMDDSLTVPLGGSARGADFPPLPAADGRRVPSGLSGLYEAAPPRSN